MMDNNTTNFSVIRALHPGFLSYLYIYSGDAIFFHSNVLHHSSANRSDMRRWAYLMTYNKATNHPVMVHHHPGYTPLEKVDMNTSVH